MNKKIFWLSIVAVIASFAGGFLLANSLNKKELDALRAENENLKKAQPASDREGEEFSLSDEEIKRKIAEADGNPSNIEFQKNLGLALYNYASMKQNAGLLDEVSRLINRVYADNPNDYTALVTLGNINFDLGYIRENNEYFQKARTFYQKALERKPNDADIITDVGLTYFLSNPPEIEPATANFEKALKINPKNEKTLQAIIQTLLSQGKKEEAEKYIAGLKEINPNNQILSNLDSPFNGVENNLQK